MAVSCSIPGNPYGTCSVCGGLSVHKDHHQCPPTWKVRFADEMAQDGRAILARDAEQAAEDFCHRYDSDMDYTIISNGEATLIVERDGVEVRVFIEAESRPHYSATIEMEG